jgi:hypothetical protein
MTRDESASCCGVDESSGSAGADIPGTSRGDPEFELAGMAAAPVPLANEPPGYRVWPFVCGWKDTPAGRVPRVDPALTWDDKVDHWRVRWGCGRRDYRVSPGLYAVGSPGEESPVLVTANYKLTFDVLRVELKNLDVWILVLDTKGINVWCAAGKGTFGTDEVARCVRVGGVAKVVSHRTLILPQLGAIGVSAHEVRRACGFSVVYGPVRAADIRAFLGAGLVARPEMRRVTFTWRERLILTPVELTNKIAPSKWIVPGLIVAGGLAPGIFSLRGAVNRGIGAVIAYLAGVVAGSVVTPLLLPWLPGRAFSYKGAVVGAATALLGVVLFWADLGWADRIALFPALTVASSYCAMLFTGSTTFTSPSGVEKEMKQALKYQASGLLLAALVWIGSRF